MTYPAILPDAPWKRMPNAPRTIVDADGLLRLAVLSEEHAELVAQAAAALPELLAAAHAALNAIDALYPGWTDDDIREKETEADTIIEARRQLRAACRRANGLRPDGTIPAPGEYP
jgi:hypothetical protein